MARCRCGALDSCGCIVIGGQDVTVTGSGSSSDPYVVAARASVVGALMVGDTLSLDLHQVGTGVPGDPMILTGDVKLGSLLQVADTTSANLTLAETAGVFTLSADVSVGGLISPVDTVDIHWTTTGSGSIGSPMTLAADIPCLDCSAPGPAGYVLTKQADGTYIPAPPVSAPVGAVNTGRGIVGDGSAGAPLIWRACIYADLVAACDTPLP